MSVFYMDVVSGQQITGLGSSLERHFGNLEEKKGWAAGDKEGTKTELSAQGSILMSANIKCKYKEKGKPVPGQAKFLRHW